MAICSIETAIEEIKNGRMVILVDDENRENEGDLVVAAEKVTPEIINFMVTYGRGLVCLPMSRELADKLNLPLMTQNNQSRFGTNFTVSIEARHGISTGISAYDRAKTILTAVADSAEPDDLVSPGHIFPLLAQPGGVLVRGGQTEGSVDLAKLAGLKPAGVLCEVMKDDGTMARMPDLEKFADKHKIKIATIKDLVNYRLQHEIRRIVDARLPTEIGDEFKVFAYESQLGSVTHLALVKGDIRKDEPILVRMHSECLTGDVFGSKRCDCGRQLKTAMQMIKQAGKGIILYMRQEGRGIGLSNKVRAYNLQDQGFDTVEANHQLGFVDDLRNYGVGAQILLDLGAINIKLLTNNPKKIADLESCGLKIVERVPLEVESCSENVNYLEAKKNKLGHLLNL